MHTNRSPVIDKNWPGLALTDVFLRHSPTRGSDPSPPRAGWDWASWVWPWQPLSLFITHQLLEAILLLFGRDGTGRPEPGLGGRCFSLSLTNSWKQSLSYLGGMGLGVLSLALAAVVSLCHSPTLGSDPSPLRAGWDWASWAWPWPPSGPSPFRRPSSWPASPCPCPCGRCTGPCGTAPAGMRIDRGNPVTSG